MRRTTACRLSALWIGPIWAPPMRSTRLTGPPVLSRAMREPSRKASPDATRRGMLSTRRPAGDEGVVEQRTDGKIEVFYDGKCPMCASLIGRVARSSKRGAFRLHDMHAERRLPFRREAVARDIHVVGRDGQVYTGADGILKIAGEYRRLASVARIAAFPLVRPLLPIGYRFAAANRRFLFGPASRIYWLKVIVVLVFCLGLALSPHLWIGPRSYPVAPVLDLLPRL